MGGMGKRQLARALGEAARASWRLPMPPGCYCAIHNPQSAIRNRSHAAVDTPPPGRLVQTGGQAGPVSLRGLNQQADSHTVAPAATVLGNTTCNVVRPTLPSNFHRFRSAGGAAPTKLNTLAPATPGGLPRRVGLAASI